MLPQLSIVVPLHNEGPNVLPLAAQIFAALRQEPRDLELILVDDASTDDTWQRMLETRRADPRVRALRQPRAAGQSAALWTGFQAARGGVIATLDGDLQNDPADLPGMLAELAHCDLVCGVRTKRRDTRVRRFSGYVARLARRLVFRVDFRDTGCGLRVFKKSVLATIPAFNGFHRFMPVIAHGGGAVVKEIPVAHRARVAGRSKYGVWSRLGRGLWDLAGLRWFLKRQLKASAPFEQTDPWP